MSKKIGCASEKDDLYHLESQSRTKVEYPYLHHLFMSPLC